MQLEIRRACRSDWCRDTIWFMLHSTRGVTKYLMRAGARVTLKAFLPILSRRSQSLSHFPDRCPGHCSNQTYFSEWKPSCQCHQCHSIPSPLLSGMHFTRSYSPSLLSPGSSALGSLRAVCSVVPDLFILCVKQNTGTSSVSTGLYFRLVYHKCHRLRTWGGG